MKRTTILCSYLVALTVLAGLTTACGNRPAPQPVAQQMAQPGSQPGAQPGAPLAEGQPADAALAPPPNSPPPSSAANYERVPSNTVYSRGNDSRRPSRRDARHQAEPGRGSFHSDGDEADHPGRANVNPCGHSLYGPPDGIEALRPIQGPRGDEPESGFVRSQWPTPRNQNHARRPRKRRTQEAQLGLHRRWVWRGYGDRRLGRWSGGCVDRCGCRRWGGDGRGCVHGQEECSFAGGYAAGVFSTGSGDSGKLTPADALTDFC